MIIPLYFKKLKTNQFCWGSRGDLMFISGQWKWIGMCSFRVTGQKIITPNKRFKSFRRGDIVQIVERDGSTYPSFDIVTAIAPDNLLDNDRVDTIPIGAIQSIDNLRTDGVGMPIRYLKKFGWNLLDLPNLLETVKQFETF